MSKIRIIEDGPFCWQNKTVLRIIIDHFEPTGNVASAIAIYTALTLVASNLPPRPVSNIVKSAGFFLKAKKAAAVVISKKVIGLPLFFLLH